MPSACFCPRCGAPLAADNPEGHCPVCRRQEHGGESQRGPAGQGGVHLATTGDWRPVQWPQPQELAGSFPQLEILHLLGSGGMGAVYKARQRTLDRLVALKILPPATGEASAFAERFAREARLLARLSHPNIVAVYDLGQVDGVYYLIMEFVEGPTLRQVLRAGGLPHPRALAIIGQLCEALQYAHEQGVVHRDIKPENILLDPQGRAKIADFGLAKLLSPGPADVALTHSRQVLGTFRYMSPEQLERPREVDHRTDIYSLGVVFYELLTGELPLGRFPPPSQKAPLDPQLDAVVLRALEKEPDRRYQQAREIHNDLETIRRVRSEGQTNDKVLGVSPEPDQRAASPLRRHLLVGLAGAVGGFLLAVGLLIAYLIENGGLPNGRPPQSQTQVAPPAEEKKPPLPRPARSGSPRKVTPPAKEKKPSPHPREERKPVPPPAVAPFDARRARQYQQAWADYLRVPVEKENTLGMKLVLIPPGEFDMGSTQAEIDQMREEAKRLDGFPGTGELVSSERPQRRVKIARPFYLGVHEVTQAQYQRVTGTNPSTFPRTGPGSDGAAGVETSRLPVETVSWNEAVAFCRKLSALPGERRAGHVYRLPVEAEWEYACRGGTTSRYYFGNEEADLEANAWYGKNSGERPHAVGLKKPNPFGLYDMHGNVGEWCAEGEGSQEGDGGGQAASPTGPQPVSRGGTWFDSAFFCRSASRTRVDDPSTRGPLFGFRVVLRVP